MLFIYFSPGAFALSKTVSVNVTYAGSDVLTKSLEAALTTKISHSTDFTMSSGSRTQLKLLIAEDVKLKKVANNFQVSFKVNLITQQNIASVSVGSCWQEQIYECAEQILRDAKITIRPNP